MKVTLLNYTPEPEKTIACAARLCYSNHVDVNSLMQDMTQEKVNKLVSELEASGHESVFEHVSFTFSVEGVSRVLTHELVRHRIASYSQRSQRYVAEDDFDYVVPPALEKDTAFLAEYHAFMNKAKELYSSLIENGIKKEDARFVLPNATTTRIIVTMNLRSLWHFFNMRCCTRAQWEIRALANAMLKICKDKFPLLFKYAGASCEIGFCREEKSCGRTPELKDLLSAYKELEYRAEMRLKEWRRKK